MKLRYTMFVILLLFVVAFAGCGTKTETVTVVQTREVEKEVRAVETVEVEKEVVVTATPKPTESPEPKEQTMVLASGRPLGPGNPHDYNSSMVLLDLLYEPLVRYGPEGTIEPALAESWEIAEDGLTWTFNLREDVVFHDGTPLDAEAVRWNLERWVGTDQHSWLPSATRIVEIETPDDATVVLTLKEPYYPAMQDLTLVRPVRLLSPKAVDDAGEFAEPVGTGPWLIESLDPMHAELVRNENYWGDTPTLERIVFEVVLDAQTRMAALLSGEVDVIGGEYLGSLSLESMPVLEHNESVEILSSAGVTSFYIVTRYEQPPFDDVRVRKALNLAIDREGISKTLFNGMADPARGLYPDNQPHVAFTDMGTYDYDPERASSLLAEAGWEENADGMLERDGQLLEMDLVVDRSRLPQTVPVAEAIQAQYADVGVDLKIRAMDYSGWAEAASAGDYDLKMGFSWGPPYDPHTQLSGAFHTDRADDEVISYGDLELDELIDAALASTDEDERQEIYNQIWEHIDERAAAIPLVYPQRVYAVRSEVNGFRLGGTEYDMAYAVQEAAIGEP